MSGPRSRLSRRQFVGGTIGTVLAGCTGTETPETSDGAEGDSASDATASRTTEETGTETEESTTEVESSGLGGWVPRPALMNEREYYLTSDVVFWNLGRIRSFEDALHPEFYDRITRVPDAPLLGLSPSAVDERIDVASQSTRVYRGAFETDTISSTLVEGGHAKDRDIGSFELFVPGEAGSRYVVGVSEDAIVVGTGASIEMAGDDDRTSEISPETAAVEVIDAHQSVEGTYPDASEPFRFLAESAESLAAGTVRTFERVSTSAPDELEFAGCVGIADGFEFSRPESEYVVTFLFSDSSEVVVEPIEEQFEQQPGLDEYDDVSHATDGSTVTLRAGMANERFDGYLPGDPDERE